MRRIFTLITSLSAIFGLTLGANFTNPLNSRDGSDPFIVYSSDGYYYLLTTTWSDIRITRAKTVGGLKTGESKVVWSDTTTSRCCNVWAPEVHWIDNAWWIYYSAGDNVNLDGQRSLVLKGGQTPWDPYTFSSQLLTEWSIDGTILRFPDTTNNTTTTTKNYFVYSCIRDTLQSLCIAPMLSPSTLGPSTLLTQPTLPWESQGDFPVAEGPAALYHNNKTYLTYSASQCWSPSYQLGLLTHDGSGDPLEAESWTKSGPVFSSANGNYGTGHNGYVCAVGLPRSDRC